MLKEDFLFEQEKQLSLNEKGESEEYFPTWGYTDPDKFIAESDAKRAELQAQAQAEAALEEERAVKEKQQQAEAQQRAMADRVYAEEILQVLESKIQDASAGADVRNNGVQNTLGGQNAQGAVQNSTATRVVWGAAYWVKRVLIILVVCLVGMVVITMIMNPDLSLFEVIDLITQKVASLSTRTSG